MLHQYWTLDLKNQTNQKLSTLLKKTVIAAHLAPSSHNTQPWLFKINKSNIEIHGNPTRQLKAADPTNREFFISLGCAYQNILVAAGYYQLDFQTEFFPDVHNPLHIATIHLKHGKNTQYQNLFLYIQQRRTNRSLYHKSKPLPNAFFNEITNTLKDHPALLKIVTDSNVVAKFANLTKQGIFTALSNPQFTQELSQWIRHPWTKIGYGMTTNTMGIPDEISFIAPAIITSSDMATTTSQSEWKMVNSSPAIGIIYALNDSKMSWIHAGMTYQLTALIATKHRLATALLSAAIEVPEQRQALAKIIRQKYPMLFVRIGYPTQSFPHSQRSTIEEIILKQHD